MVTVWWPCTVKSSFESEICIGFPFALPISSVCWSLLILQLKLLKTCKTVLGSWTLLKGIFSYSAASTVMYFILFVGLHSNFVVVLAVLQLFLTMPSVWISLKLQVTIYCLKQPLCCSNLCWGVAFVDLFTVSTICQQFRMEFRNIKSVRILSNWLILSLKPSLCMWTL